MSLVLCACSLFGNLFVIRTLQIFRERALISQTTLTKIGTLAICGGVFAVFFFIHRPLAATFACLFAWLTPLPALLAIERRKLTEYRDFVPLFLDRWIMNLKLGAASTSARDAALTTMPAPFQALIRPIFAPRMVATPVKSPLLHGFAARELARLANEPHLALPRLENLREVLRKSDDFRRKSGQATRQTAIQSAVMLILFFPLLIFTVHLHGWDAISDLVLWSVLLTAFGAVAMQALARKTRWKI
jgi:Flp pilus assembly protein TadB